MSQVSDFRAAPAFQEVDFSLRWAWLLALSISFLSSVYAFVGLLCDCTSGFDFSDEGAYLQWISHPWSYHSSVTQFGFIYHPLYLLSSGRIPVLRQLNVCITYALGYCFSRQILGATIASGRARDRMSSIVLCMVSFTLASATFSLFGLWLLTPGYNSLTLQALLITGIGGTLLVRHEGRWAFTGASLIGAGVAVACLAKPTTGGVLSLVVACFMLKSKWQKKSIVAMAALTFACLIAFAVIEIDGNALRFAQRISVGLVDARSLEAGHALANILRWDGYHFEPVEKILLVTLSLGIAGTTYLAAGKSPFSRTASAALVLGSAVLGCVLTYTRLGVTIKFGLFRELLLLAIPGGALVEVAIRWHSGETLRHEGQYWASILFLGLLPFIYAFGTNRNYWLCGSEAAVFWVVGGIAILLGGCRRRRSILIAIPATVVLQALTAVLTQYNGEHANRQSTPIIANEAIVQGIDRCKGLRVNRDTAAYLGALKSITAANDFPSGGHILDLTGRFPGALYLVGADSLGLAWLIGGYNGSEALALRALGRESHEQLADCWILTEVDGPRAIPPTILDGFGLKLGRDYVNVGMLRSPNGEYPGGLTQVLYKPASR
jgi:hypothetical protein